MLAVFFVIMCGTEWLGPLQFHLIHNDCCPLEGFEVICGDGSGLQHLLLVSFCFVGAS